MRWPAHLAALLGLATAGACGFPDYRFLRCEPGSAACGPDAAPPPEAGACEVLASDGFSGDGTGGFGAADLGGSWDVADARNASVAGGVGRVVLGAGAGAEAILDGPPVLDVDETIVFATDKVLTSGDADNGMFVYLHGRKVDRGKYWIGLWLTEEKKARLGVTRDLGGEEVTLDLSRAVFGIDHTPGAKLRLRARFEGARPTTIRGRVWNDGEGEPPRWTIEATDATPELQVAGRIGFKAYLSVRATNGPITFTFDDFVARRAGSCPP
jgi:hypothetical protein